MTRQFKIISMEAEGSERVLIVTTLSNPHTPTTIEPGRETIVSVHDGCEAVIVSKRMLKDIDDPLFNVEILRDDPKSLNDLSRENADLKQKIAELEAEKAAAPQTHGLTPEQMAMVDAIRGPSEQRQPDYYDNAPPVSDPVTYAGPPPSPAPAYPDASNKQGYEIGTNTDPYPGNQSHDPDWNVEPPKDFAPEPYPAPTPAPPAMDPMALSGQADNQGIQRSGIATQSTMSPDVVNVAGDTKPPAPDQETVTAQQREIDAREKEFDAQTDAAPPGTISEEPPAVTHDRAEDLLDAAKKDDEEDDWNTSAPADFAPEPEATTTSKKTKPKAEPEV